MTIPVYTASPINMPDGSWLPPLVPDPAAIGEPFPLTPTQQALWVGRADAVELGNIGCYGYFEWERSNLDVARYRRAWERLVEHHPGLRTVVRPDGTQVVLDDPGRVPIAVDDLRDDPHAEQRLAESRAVGSHRALDPETWPMFDLRVTLLPGRVRLQFGIDLQLMDASSLFLALFPDLVTLYEDPDAVLAPQPIAFRDFARWIGEDVRGSERWQRDWEYWQARIDGLPPAPDLPPAPRAEREAAADRFERCTIRYTAERFAVLRERAAAYGISETALLTGAFAEILRGWSANESFTLNVPVFQRFGVPGAEHVIGDYTNAILLEATPDGATIAERITAVASRLRADIDHATVNGVDVLRELTRRRGATVASMPVVVTSLLGVKPARSIGELGREVHSITQTPQVSLDFQIREEDGELRLVWDYRAGTFAPGVVADAFAAYCKLVERFLVDEPGRGIWQAPHAEVRSQRDLAVRAEVNDTATPLADELLHERFFAQAEQTPDAEAVVTTGRRLTYSQLAGYARRIGHVLRDQGVRPGELVGIVMEKGWEQYAALYGILAAGGAYLPLDAAAPPQRTGRLLQAAGVRTVLTQSWLAGSLDLPPGVTSYRADTDFEPGPGFEPGSAEPLPSVQGPGDLAYVIYTSGSTGNPKGVMVAHRGVVNLVTDVQRRFGITAADRLLAISGLHFDASIYDVFGPLSCGAAVIVPPPFQRAEPDRWADLVRDEHVTIWNSVPVLMELLTGEAETRHDLPLGTLRLAVLSGDWIPLTLPDRMRAQAPYLQVVGSGGPTETICWSLFYPIGAVDPQWTSIPYGKPIANQRYYIVDKNLQERPTWARGEMAVASPLGLAIGYLGDPERTAAKFVTLPETGERAYLTGDFGRYLPDGNIEILGREDFQVKVAGQRIELGEVEAALNRVAEVQAAVVAAPKSTHAVVRLQAFVVLVPGADVTADMLRAHLSRELPAAMVPASITLLPELPLTRNGKVDRLELANRAGGAAPAATPASGPAPAPAAAPTGAGLLAEVIAACVGEVLGLAEVGAADNFFRLGGDSLSGTRLARRLHELLSTDVPIRTVFENPVIADLAAVIAADPARGPQALRVAELLNSLEEQVAGEERHASAEPVQAEPASRVEPTPQVEPTWTETARVEPTWAGPASAGPAVPDEPRPQRQLIAFTTRAVIELAADDPELAGLLEREHARQEDTLMMVAASSVAPPSVLACAGSSLANLTMEGYPGARYHAGAEFADGIERLAIARACTLFGAQAANVQPHSGSSANLAVLMGLLQPGDTILGLDLDCGGHLTHGSRASVTGRYFRSVSYRTGADGRLDYEQIAALAAEHRPDVIIAGASAYPRRIDFARFRAIADAAGAYLIADISHIAGLVAAGLHPSPVDEAHVTTTSTYKQLYGPRGGLILLGRDAGTPGPDGRTPLRALLDRAVFPLAQGTPDLGNVAAKARAFDAAARPEFRERMALLTADAKAIAMQFERRGLSIVTGGTDTHMVLADLRPAGITGAEAEAALEACGIVVNKNRVPGDRTPARVTGGLRIGTNTLAARGITPATAARCADLIADVIGELRTTPASSASGSGRSLSQETVARVRAAVKQICTSHPLPGYRCT
jgi:pyochelin synthetase